MIDKTLRELLLEIWQSMYGVPDTEEKGLLKRVASIDDKLCKMNGCITTNTIWRKAIVGVGGTAILLIITVLLHLMGVY